MRRRTVTERDILPAFIGAHWPRYGRHVCVAAALALVTACASPGPANAAPEAEPGSVFRPGDNIAGKYLAGRHAESIGDYAAAADLTRDVLKVLPEDESLLVRTHLLMISVGRVPEAVEIARRIVARDQTDALGNLTLGLADLEAGKYDAALASFDRLPLERANRIVVPLLRAWTYAGKGDTTAALAALDTFNASGNFTVIAGLHGGMIAELNGDDTAAAAAYARAAASIPAPCPNRSHRRRRRGAARRCVPSPIFCIAKAATIRRWSSSALPCSSSRATIP